MTDDINLKYVANIGDLVIYKGKGEACEGFVRLISMRGVSASSPKGEVFINWEDVLDINKSRKAPWMEESGPLLPTEFARMMHAIFPERGYDKEAAHGEADQLICKLLSSLGYDEGAAIFESAEKRYG